MKTQGWTSLSPTTLSQMGKLSPREGEGLSHISQSWKRARLPPQACALSATTQRTEKGGAGKDGRHPLPELQLPRLWGSRAGGGEDGAADTSRQGIQGLGVQDRVAEGAEKQGSGPGVRQKGRKSRTHLG